MENPSQPTNGGAVRSIACSAPRGQQCPEYGWWLDPLTDCCGETMVRMDRGAGEYVTWHGYKKDDEPKELRCYRCDKIVWPNAVMSQPAKGSDLESPASSGLAP